MPPRASTRNPLDIGAAGPLVLSIETLVEMGKEILSSGEVDALVLHGFGRAGLVRGEVPPYRRMFLDFEKKVMCGYDALQDESDKPVVIGCCQSPLESQAVSDLTGEGIRIEQRLDDVFLFVPGEDNDHCGVNELVLAKHTLPPLVVADILIEIEQVLRVVGNSHSVERLRLEWERFIAGATSLDRFHGELPGFVDRLAALPRSRNPLTCPRVLVTGDFFTRFSPFFMEGVRELYNERGIILKPVDLMDLFLYGSYDSVVKVASRWGLKPGRVAMAKACTRIFRADGKEYLQQWLAYQSERRSEAHYRGIMRASGLLVSAPRDMASLFARASEHVSPEIFGEAIPTVGDGIKAESEGYDGIVVIGPFNCLPFRISEAILKPVSIQRGMPILTYESDGYAVPPSFLRQVEVHAQQVIDHRSGRSPESSSGANLRG